MIRENLNGTTEVWGWIGNTPLMATWHSPDEFYSLMRKEIHVNTNGIAVQEEQAIARPLRVLVPLIKDELAAGAAAGMEHYRNAGRLLIEAKEKILKDPQHERGAWGGWLTRHFKLSAKTAQAYMRLVQHEKVRGLTFSSLMEMESPGRTTHCPPYTAGVREILQHIDLDVIRARGRDEQIERAIRHELAGQLVDIGYKVLATKMHPDKGGSHEAMTRLNAIRHLLKEAV